MHRTYPSNANELNIFYFTVDFASYMQVHMSRASFGNWRNLYLCYSSVLDIKKKKVDSLGFIT